MKASRFIFGVLLVILIALLAVSLPIMAADNEDEDGDEVTVTIDQVPAAVAETIRKEAGTGTIGEIEKEIEKGVTVYEAEITRDGKKLEIEVAEDGKLLEVEEDD